MINSNLVSPRRLRSLIRARLCVVVDCRFDLGNPEGGREKWLQSHIPGAHYAHLDNDLSSPITAASGRHPLPETQAFADYLGSIGWSEEKLLVAYDDAGNAMAGRLWWLMKFYGQSAALLDGGFPAWLQEDYPVESGPVLKPATLAPSLIPNQRATVQAADVLDGIETGSLTVLDARAPDRFSGATEPLDSKGGHIPGALNRPFQFNLDETGRFKQPEDLRREFEALLGDRHPSQLAHSCGSGVTACHNVFAMELAGLNPAVLYPGSWSEWIRDPDRPIATG